MILDTIKNRRSIRKFQEKEIPKDIIDKLMEALIWAPSAANLQSRKFYFVFDKQKREKLDTAKRSFFAEAPLVVVGCADDSIGEKYGERGKNLYTICDVSASIQNMLLMAYDLGLGTVWVGAFDEENVREVLSLPNNLRPIVIVPVGFPDEKPEAPPRVSKEEATQII